MRKSLFTSTTAGIMTLFLMTACGEESKDTVTAENTKVLATETTGETGSRDDSIMDQPVDFSTPENVKKTLRSISENAGADMAKQIESKMSYMMVYDLSVGHNEEKLNKKLNGKTPNEIIAMMKR